MCLKTHSQACGSIFSTIGVHTNTDAFFDPGRPKGGRITVGVQPREGERERAGLSGTTSKYLFLSFCMDLTVLIWQQLRYGCVRETEIH